MSWKHLHVSAAKGNLARHSLCHYIDHMSGSSSNIPESSSPATLYLHVRGQRSRQSYDHKKVAVPTRDTCHELTVLIWIGFLNQSSWTVRFPFYTLGRHCDQGCFYWSLIRLFDIHPTSSLNVRRSLSASSCCAVSSETLLRSRTPTALSATSKVDRGHRGWIIHHTEYATLSKTRRKINLVPQVPLLK